MVTTVRRMCAKLALGLTLLFIAGCSSSSSSQKLDQGKDNITPSVAVAADAPWTSLVTSLVQAMTLDEKLNFVHGDNIVLTNVKGTGYTHAVERLGIPARYDADSMGVLAPGTTTTSIPLKLGLASSFDRSLFDRVGAMVGQEGRAAGADVIYGPQIDLARVPNWNRNQTAVGEDPYLSGQLTAHEVNAIQNAGLMACVKHIGFYDGSGGSYLKVDDQTIHELALENYRPALEEAQAAMEMCSYAEGYVAGQMDAPAYSCHNNWLNNVVLRSQFGWRGFIVSDYGATQEADILDGLDEEFGAPVGFASYYLSADSSWASTVSSYADQLQALDNAVAVSLYQYERFGLLKCASAAGPVSGCTLDARPDIESLRAADWTTTQEAAEETAVLLKNQGSVLPLTSADLTGKGVLVVGGPARQLLNAIGERSKGTPERSMISPLQKLKELAGAGAKITYLPGLDWVGTPIGSASDATAATYKITAEDGFSVQDIASGGVVTTATAPSIDGHAVPLGGSTTVSGTIDVPTAGNYFLWVRGRTLTQSAAAASGNLAGFYDNFSVQSAGFYVPGVGEVGGNTGPYASLALDGASVRLSAAPVQPETYWSEGLDGYVSLGSLVSLTAGMHTLSATFDSSLLDTSTYPDGLHVKLSYASIDADREAAAAAAAGASKVIVFADDAGNTQTSSSSDVVGWLDTYTTELISALAAQNARTAVVLNVGNPVQMPWRQYVSSILVMWYPGQEGGTATANVLLGNVNPGGRLAITFPASNADTPFYGDNYGIRIGGGQTDASGITYSEVTEGIFSGYRWYDKMGIAPMFAFGEGLSYTTFEYSGLKLAKTEDGFQATFTLKNTGPVAGSVVPQLYVGSTDALLPAGVQQARKKLVGFDRITLAAGKSATLSMTVGSHELSYWSTDLQGWIKPTGTRMVYVGDSSRDSAIQLASSFTLE